MPHPKTDALLDRVVALLKKHGVRDHVLAIRDPDSDEDAMRWVGSVWWRIGVGRVVSREAVQEHDTNNEPEVEK